jgi:ribosomal protein L40E
MRGARTCLELVSYTRLVLICERCDNQNPDGAKFCNGCGAPLAEIAAPSALEERKVVSVLAHPGGPSVAAPNHRRGEGYVEPRKGVTG